MTKQLWIDAWVATWLIQAIVSSSLLYGDSFRFFSPVKFKNLPAINEARLASILCGILISIIPIIGLIACAIFLGIIEIKFEAYYLNFILPFGLADRKLRKNVADPNVQQRLVL